ncbi:MAG: hypothetical protein CM1200mP3_12380 [Chloroflexota bacterium]|nr:MAG: hypothetical protein CM1200mP3_12380 [Chloroflexota bacterium]
MKNLLKRQNLYPIGWGLDDQKTMRTYDLKETLYSGQAFRWIELSQCLEQNITVHQSVISGHRVNLWESVGTIMRVAQL